MNKKRAVLFSILFNTNEAQLYGIIEPEPEFENFLSTYCGVKFDNNYTKSVSIIVPISNLTETSNNVNADDNTPLLKNSTLTPIDDRPNNNYPTQTQDDRIANERTALINEMAILPKIQDDGRKITLEEEGSPNYEVVAALKASFSDQQSRFNLDWDEFSTIISILYSDDFLIEYCRACLSKEGNVNPDLIIALQRLCKHLKRNDLLLQVLETDFELYGTYRNKLFLVSKILLAESGHNFELPQPALQLLFRLAKSESLSTALKTAELKNWPSKNAMLVTLNIMLTGALDPKRSGMSSIIADDATMGDIRNGETDAMTASRLHQSYKKLLFQHFKQLLHTSGIFYYKSSDFSLGARNTKSHVYIKDMMDFAKKKNKRVSTIVNIGKGHYITLSINPDGSIDLLNSYTDETSAEVCLRKILKNPQIRKYGTDLQNDIYQCGVHSFLNSLLLSLIYDPNYTFKDDVELIKSVTRKGISIKDIMDIASKSSDPAEIRKELQNYKNQNKTIDQTFKDLRTEILDLSKEDQVRINS